MNLTNRIVRILDLTRTNANKLSFLGPLLIRLTVGLVFIGTGWGKLHSLGDVTTFFESLHIPLPGLNARVAASTEFFGGILILVGLGSRLVALPLSFTMVVAILTAKRDSLDGFTTLVGFEEWSYLVMFLLIALTGPGAASLDYFISRRMAARAQASTLPQPRLAPTAAVASRP